MSQYQSHFYKYFFSYEYGEFLTSTADIQSEQRPSENVEIAQPMARISVSHDHTAGNG